MRIRKHPDLDLWCREDGAVCLPPCPNIHRFKHTWTYGYKDRKGYLRVKYRGKHYQVHRLICETFHGLAPKDGLTADHINRNKLDNRPSNLRWADYKMQRENQQNVDDSLAKYGVRKCQDPAGYRRAILANNPEYAERQRTYMRDYRAKQKAIGKKCHTCPDGKHRYLTDSEFAALYG